MVILNEIKLKTNVPFSSLKSFLEKKLGLSEGSIKDIKIIKESIDAREKPIIFRVFNLVLTTDIDDNDLIDLCHKHGVKFAIKDCESFGIDKSSKKLSQRPVVAGFGPCGIFAALALAKMGFNPIVVERGACMEKRVKLVEEFWQNEKLDFSTNVQFGEGGAGTFSDGKLTTGTKFYAHEFILNEFVKAGANENILYLQRPHIGSDVLRTVVVNIRKEIESLGGEFMFETRLESLDIQDNKVAGVYVSNNNGKSYIKTDNVILALGHSARDTARELYEEGLTIEQKPFSIGYRIEHLQEDIDMAQYAALHEDLGIGAADYKLNVKTKSGRGVYTFCMCPGGVVVNASSHEGCVVTNGMSYSARNGKHANSAVLCDVYTSDFESDHPLAGMDFQEKYERKTYEVSGGYKLVTDSVGAFLKGGSKLEQCIPEFAVDAIKEALPALAKKLKGFAAPDAKLYAAETRSSSPIKIKRDNGSLEALINDDRVKGLYPAGEGAGYAGGIMSAAADGIRIALKLEESI